MRLNRGTLPAIIAGPKDSILPAAVSKVSLHIRFQVSTKVRIQCLNQHTETCQHACSYQFVKRSSIDTPDTKHEKHHHRCDGNWSFSEADSRWCPE